MENAIQPLFFLVIIIFSVVLHEVSHGYVALFLGDRTAQLEGRLTLNPIPHIDLFGSIILPLMLVILGVTPIAYAKPVPYNPYNLRNQKWGPAIVGSAGPLANILLAVIFGLIIRFLPGSGFLPGLFIFNFLTIAGGIVFLNLMLAIFNLVPIPPLDGSKVLFAILPYQWSSVQFFLERWGTYLLLFLIFIAPGLLFSGLLIPLVIFLFRLLTGGLPLL